MTEDFEETKEIKLVFCFQMSRCIYVTAHTDCLICFSSTFYFFETPDFLLQGYCVPYHDGVKGDPGPPGQRVSGKNRSLRDGIIHEERRSALAHCDSSEV